MWGKSEVTLAEAREKFEWFVAGTRPLFVPERRPHDFGLGIRFLTGTKVAHLGSVYQLVRITRSWSRGNRAKSGFRTGCFLDTFLGLRPRWRIRGCAVNGPANSFLKFLRISRTNPRIKRTSGAKKFGCEPVVPSSCTFSRAPIMEKWKARAPEKNIDEKWLPERQTFRELWLFIFQLLRPITIELLPKSTNYNQVTENTAAN